MSHKLPCPATKIHANKIPQIVTCGLMQKHVASTVFASK